MVRIVKSDLPDEWEGSPPEVDAEIIADDKAYVGLHPADMPAFYAQAGLLEGCFERLAALVWFDGEVTLVITQGNYQLEGLINIYGEEPTLIDNEPVYFAAEVERIEAEAKKLASSFRADSFRVGFKITATFKLDQQRGGFAQH